MDQPKPWLQNDSLREREFYKYYNPIQALSEDGPSLTDVTELDIAKIPKPCSSPDVALTAFCQLGALRLGTARCMLMFFDTEFVYVLAEATRTLSLQDDDVHDFNDDLWLGYTIMRRGLSVCEHTINVPPELIDNHYSEDIPSVYVINDLEQSTTFCNRPFVTDGPKLRFYAGVPITTPANIRIGVYCVLDDKPRDGLKPGQADFLSQMSQTVMSHLETVRERSELAMGSNMLTGLGELITNSTTNTLNTLGGEGHRLRPAPPQRQERSMRSSLPTRNGTLRKRTLDEAAKGRNLSDTDRPTMDDRAPSCESSTTVSSEASRGSPGIARKANVDTQNLFRTAAHLLRSSAEADGSLFLDATIHTYGGAVATPSLTDEDGAQARNQRPATYRRVLSDGQSASNVACRSLGSATSNLRDPGMRQAMSEKFLAILLKKYPGGKVWSFNPDERAYSTVPDSNASATAGANGLVDDGELQVNGERRELSEDEQLQILFPGVRALCLVGMWDAIRDRWYAGTFIWSNSHSRVFSRSTELVFMIAFCDLLMSEITRLESQLESKAKSDFISSISHELRSPLQGILCGIDLLSETKSVDRPVISQIEQCSTTLLEIINHLLEFANINNLGGRRKTSLDQADQNGAGSTSNGPTTSDANSIRRITEEMCDSMYYSHSCGKGLPQSTNVDLILDLSADANVSSNTVIGAWKRICMNIINNALKYTSNGYVAVSLKAQTSEQETEVLVLSVVDTGRGMSAEFMNNRLFRPFEQEDDMSPGTGLGMSLVSKLVDSLGGEIQVQSQKDSGTTITISIPVDGGSFSLSNTPIGQPCQGIRIGLPEPASIGKGLINNSQKLLQAALQQTCRQLGADITPSDDADIQMIFESDAEATLARSSSRPIIVLCDNFVSALRMQQHFDASKRDRHIQCIAQPFGLIRLSTAIQGGIQTWISSNETRNNEKAVEDPPIERADFAIPSRRKIAMPSTADTMSPLQSPKTVMPHNPMQNHNLEQFVQPSPEIIASQPSTDGQTVKRRSKEFNVSFGLPQEKHIDNAGSTPSKEKSKANYQDSPVSLVLVDDNAINLRMLVAYADKHSYHRLTAMNGQEAFDVYVEAVQLMDAADPPSNGIKALNGKPIVILLDLNMPVMDGFEAARRIRAFERSRALSAAIIIAVTGLGSTEARQNAHACGMDLFLTKPVRPRDLTEVLAPIIASTPDSPAVVDGPG